MFPAIKPPDSLYGVYLLDPLTVLKTKDSELLPDMFTFSLLLLLSIAKSSIADQEECLKLLCNPGDPECHPCPAMSADQLGTWRLYIDALLQNLSDEEVEEDYKSYYQQIREEPLCCNISSGESCTIKLIDEPNVLPHRIYETGCLRQNDFWKTFICMSANSRCCNTSFCNLPLKEELAKFIVEVPKYYTLIVILSIFLVLAFLMLIAGWCFWRCRDKAASQMPVSMVGAGCIGDAAGRASPGDSRPWHMAECGGSGASMVSAVPSATTAASASVVAVNGGVLNATAANSGVSVATTLIDSIPLHPSRAPFLMASSSISSVVAARSPRGLGAVPTGISSYHNSISGSTVVRGSEIVGHGSGCGGGGASYTAASGGASMVPASCSAPPGAGGTLEITLSGSGSGAGQPLLVERTVARQVTLSARIGEGRYGEVWLGRLHGDQVAVKIFSSRNENSWIREKEIYETATLRHSNILGFIAADNKDNGISTELWLIAEYHRLGSLYEFLQTHAFTLPALIKMASSIANGLAHLHMAIVGTSGKPPIAHRDLKSRNILVKADGECCIGDLGFAVKYDSLTGRVDIGRNTERVGTKRYMAPEVLDNTLCAQSFDAYMQADIYSLGLVFWEMTRRVHVANLYGPEEYQLPYQVWSPQESSYDNVGPDPLIEEMKSVVCELGIRPHLPLVWQTDASLRLLYHIMTECWSANPSHRLSAMRIKKDLANQRQQLGSPRQPSETPLPPHILRQQPSSLDALPPGVFVYRSAETASPANNANTSTLVTDQVGETDVEEALLASGGPTVQPPNVVATAAMSGGRGNLGYC
ncbi:unnamed protein product [Hydatigera taeniaeformis]|uniref:receptor protein serine/threonine kinase n=1 Tax=Hydatigena taeniaeformis TaxID=6205 RepID=A0A0R3X683_HYDTA|nr:unnamed protein product [Hydatigera taeniaeformis]